MRWPDLTFIPARSFSPGRPAGPPRLVVVHYTAGSEGPTAAENGARYDQRRTDGTSAHYYVDSDSVVQCVDTAHRSHTARYNGNLWGIHYELCGTVQTRAQWLDATSRPTIRNAARQMARDMRHHGIPLVRLRSREVRSGAGVCGHVDCTVGWPEDGGDHTDPCGSRPGSFPWDVLLADIEEFLADAGSVRSAEPEETTVALVPLTEYNVLLVRWTNDQLYYRLIEKNGQPLVVDGTTLQWTRAPINTVMASAPGACPRGNNTVYAAFLAPDATVTWATCDDIAAAPDLQTWSVSSLGGSASSAPDVIDDGVRIAVSVRGGNGAARVKTYTSTGGWTGWFDHGGTVK
jgi:hypothetical protein